MQPPKLAVQKVFLHHFIPTKLLTEERMKRLLSIWLSLESCHYDIIRDMMVSSYCLRCHMRSLMKLVVSAPRDDPRIEVLQYEVLEVLDRSKSSPSKLMEEFVTILAKNQSIRTAMETIVQVESNTTKQLISISANVICTLKIINRAVAQMVELILFKILLFGIDVSSFTVLVLQVMKDIKEGGNISNHNPGKKELRLLYELLSWQPHLAFDENVVKFFLELLTVGDTDHITQTLKIISLLSKPPGKPLGEVYPGLTQEHLVPLLQRLAIIGTPKQAKYSIRCLTSHAIDKREHVFHPVLKDMHKVLSCRDEHYETVITAVGHWAVHLPTDLRLQQSFYKVIDTFIHTNIVKELLYSKVVTSEEPLTCTWYKDYEIPAHTRCMNTPKITPLCNVAVTLTKHVFACRNTPKITPLCNVAVTLTKRVFACCALLKICEVPALWTFFSTALLTKLVCLITDKVKQVRLGFARRLTRGLCKEPGLPNDLLAFFPLSELSPDKQVCQQMREMLRKAIAAKRLRYRRLVLIEQVAVSTDQLINSHAHLLVEHSVGAAVFLLAFHPLFFAIDSWFDLYQVQCALKQLLEELITAAPLRMDDKFYKELFTAIHSSRNTLVPDDELANKKMWAACELGLSLLPNLQKGSGKVKTPEKFLLPVYFEPSSQTAWTDYIPTSLAKKLKSGKGGQRSATSPLEEVQPPSDKRVNVEDEESENEESEDEESEDEEEVHPTEIRTSIFPSSAVEE
uniref:Uncharacterized protein n=1 Tax=Timema genevievae TaxID=629358 RepID=A0A7R9K1M9_TIMGE|nr:unnamed protein product [Timema genevievae]